jgi:hypothetical protein
MKKFTCLFLLFLTLCLHSQNNGPSLEGNILAPEINLNIGFSFGSQPIWPSIIVGTNFGYGGVKLGVEATLGMFIVAGWSSTAFLIGYDFGMIEIGHKFAYSSLGAGGSSNKDYSSNIIYTRFDFHDEYHTTYVNIEVTKFFVL